MDKENSLGTLLDATFSFNGNHYFEDRLRHDFIDIKWNNEIDFGTPELNGLILDALKWASKEVCQDVELTGLGPQPLADRHIVIPIKYLSFPS
ncbi:hypothetical protein [Dysgonomonas capnocytophagoides]|uniref:hypothetical protein n=1 Tax=Dysgonomonas capnocytophagoides TaxID=45254 RepID=UPI002921E8EA|nr:hypothetical protein DCPSUM001_01370 [Dysgonomonas capnocytophagoides]